jgi:nitronate monooxygenase
MMLSVEPGAMFPDTLLSKVLGIEYPIIQAPMAGGPATPELIAAVSNAGGLGSLAGGMLSPDAIRQGVGEVRRLTGKPFSVNLFVLETPHPSAELITKASGLLDPIRSELGLAPEAGLTKFCEEFSEQFEALLEVRPVLASFTFGILSETQISALKSRGILVCGTATTVAEARAWEAVGADLICAQGAEAGAHRGTFLSDFESSLVGTMALVPQVVDAVRIPLIAAGGIMDGRGIAAAHVLGAAGVQMGTAFMLCAEAGTSSTWKSALRGAKDDQTRVSRVYSGKPARGLVNDFMRRFTPVESEIPPYPIQNALTGPIRRAAAKANRPEFLSLWAGQAASMCREVPVAELLAALVEETIAALRGAAAP